MANEKASSLILDYNLYPRTRLDPGNVAVLREAIRVGTELPPVVADRKSRRVVDGFHRVRAHLLENGADAEIAVEWRDYESDADLFLDAIRRNSGHGKNFDPHDRVHCAIAGATLKIDDADLAAALSMTVDRFSTLRAGRTAVGSGGLEIPLKGPVKHLKGRKLTKKQTAAMGGVGGMDQKFYVNQLIRFIENDLLDTDDKKLMDRIAKLHGMLDGVLAKA